MQIHGEGKFDCLEAVYVLLSWIKGVFEFGPLALRIADEIKTPGPQLMRDTARRLDVARR